MSARDDGGPAFPEVTSEYSEWAGHGGTLTSVYSVGGMTLRDHFAGLAMQALVAQRAFPVDHTTGTKAYEVADMMLAARSAP